MCAGSLLLLLWLVLWIRVLCAQVFVYRRVHEKTERMI